MFEMLCRVDFAIGANSTASNCGVGRVTKKIR